VNPRESTVGAIKALQFSAEKSTIRPNTANISTVRKYMKTS
jgi:hypothetical protein